MTAWVTTNNIRRGVAWLVLAGLLAGLALPVAVWAAAVRILYASASPNSVEYGDYDGLAAIVVDDFLFSDYRERVGTCRILPPGVFPAAGGLGTFDLVFTPAEGEAEIRGVVELNVLPRTVTTLSIAGIRKVYDGTVGRTGAVVDLLGVQEGDDVAADIDFTFAEAGAGTQLLQGGDFIRLTGADKDRYALSWDALPEYGKITPFPGGECLPAEYLVGTGTGEPPLLDLDALVRWRGPEDKSSRVYTYQSMTDNGLLDGEPALTGSLLELRLAASLRPGLEATIHFTMKSENYAETPGSIRLYTQRQSGVVTGVAVGDKTYDRQPVRPSGTPVVGDEPVVEPVYLYQGEGYYSAEPPRDAGRYTLTVSTPPESLVDARSEAVEFTIQPAPLTIRPVNTVIAAGEPVPTAFDFLYIGLIGGDEDTISPKPIARADLTDTGAETDAPIAITNRPQAANYAVSLEAGVLSVRAGALDNGYYTVAEPGASGWYREPILLRPAKPALFDEIATAPDGPFGPSLTLTEETGAGSVALYFRKGTRVVPGPAFLYRLDCTPPVIREIRFAEGKLAVAAADALSGVAEIAVTGPDGASLVRRDSVFPAALPGEYTISVTDQAGNQRTETKTQEESEAGTEPSPEPTQPTRSPTQSSRSNSSGGSGGSSARDGAGDGDAFWDSLAARLRTAAEGDTVRVMTAQQRDRIPADVLRALRGRDVLLRLVRPDGDLPVYGMDIPALDKTVYTVPELRELLAGSLGRATPGDPDRNGGGEPVALPAATEPTEPDEAAPAPPIAREMTAEPVPEPSASSEAAAEDDGPLPEIALAAWEMAGAAMPVPVSSPTGASESGRSAPVLAVALSLATTASAVAAVVIALRKPE